MYKNQTRQLIGIAYIIAGALLLFWASSILIHLLIFIVGLMLINSGLVLTGNNSLWFYASRIFFNRFKMF